ncbi:Mannosyltransferase [Psidium guajava]|nr:Mannosyltransferase [Psidium guajava]
MNTALCTLFLFLASSLILFHAEPAVANVVPETCRKCVALSPNVNYDFCVKALGSDRRSQTADVQGLGLIALNLLESSVTSTGSYIQQLLKKKWDPYVQGCLEACSELYSDAVDTTKEAVEAYQAKHYTDVQTWVSTVATDGDTCESQFKEKPGVTSPLTKQSGDTGQLSSIGLAILAIVTGS